MYNPFSLEGKTILVTGASSGIGRQCAIDCSKMGAKVVAVARNQERLSETLSLMDGSGHSCYSYDLSNTEGIGELVSKMVTECGKFDGMVYAAGVEKTLPFKLLKPSDYKEVFRVNTLSAFEMTRNLCNIKHFNKSLGGGSIVLVASITAIIARGGTAAYSASKGALLSTARVLAQELSSRKIRVNCVSPGTILTPMMQNYLEKLSEEDYKKRVGGFPLGLGETTDISNACIFLLSNASRWITGQNFIIDGGFTMQ